MHLRRILRKILQDGAQIEEKPHVSKNTRRGAPAPLAVKNSRLPYFGYCCADPGKPPAVGFFSLPPRYDDWACASKFGGTRLLRASPCHITESREQLRPRHPSYESSDSLSLPPKHAWHGLICSSPPLVRAYFHARMRSCSECHRRPARQQFPPLQPRNSETTAC